MAIQEKEERPKPLVFYVAGPFSKKEQMSNLMDRIKKMGHRVAADWTTHLSIKPYENNPEMAKQYAKEDIEGASNCDIFILFPGEKGGTSRFAELGASIVSEEVKRVFVVGPHKNRSLMAFHTKVERVDSIEEVFIELFPHG